MKAFLTWATIHLILFAGLAFGIHTWLSSSPTRIFIAVDASYPMQDLWPTVMDRVDRLGKKARYKEFAVVTDKNKVHGWQTKPALVSSRAYGPRQLEVFADTSRYPEANDADVRILITNEKTLPPSLSDWQQIKP